jgi:hypothetical protein
MAFPLAVPLCIPDQSNLAAIPTVDKTSARNPTGYPKTFFAGPRGRSWPIVSTNGNGGRETY